MRDSELIQEVANRLRYLENMCVDGSPALQLVVRELGEESVGACDRVWARWGNVLQMAIGKAGQEKASPESAVGLSGAGTEQPTF